MNINININEEIEEIDIGFGQTIKLKKPAKEQDVPTLKVQSKKAVSLDIQAWGGVISTYH
jgi:hypothetical protein